MGRMTISFRDKETRLLPNVTLEEFRKADRGLRLGEILFIRFNLTGDDQVRFYIVGESRLDEITGMSFIPTSDAEVTAVNQYSA